MPFFSSQLWVKAGGGTKAGQSMGKWPSYTETTSFTTDTRPRHTSDGAAHSIWKINVKSGSTQRWPVCHWPITRRRTNPIHLTRPPVCRRLLKSAQSGSTGATCVTRGSTLQLYRDIYNHTYLNSLCMMWSMSSLIGYTHTSICLEDLLILYVDLQKYFVLSGNMSKSQHIFWQHVTHFFAFSIPVVFHSICKIANC